MQHNRIKESGKRRSYTMPPHLLKELEEEANRRIDVSNMNGHRLTGGVVRDILCIAVKCGKSLSEIKQMHQDEFEKLAKVIN